MSASVIDNYQRLIDMGIRLHRQSGQTKELCPRCSHTRKNKKEKCLSVNIDDGTFHCHNPGCDFRGSVRTIQKAPEKIYKRPPIWTNNTALSDALVKWFNLRGISQQTLIKMKIGEGVEWMPGKGDRPEGPINTLQFPYFRNGQLINIKYRSRDKGFRMFGGAELILCNVDSIRDTDSVIICEGEIDMLSLIEAGFENVVSVPNGASEGNANLEYLDNCYEFLDNKKKFILCTDNDDPGRALKEELIRRIGADKCFTVDYGKEEDKFYKDANEVLVGDGKLKLQEIIENAKPCPLRGVKTVDDLNQDLVDLHNSGLKPGDQVGIRDEQGRELVSFVPGMFTEITGIPSHGKALSIETPIPTPDGFRLMKDILPGDVIYDHNGKEISVIAATEIMYGRPCYEIEFSDGSKIICDENHQWLTDTWRSKRSAYNSQKKNRLDTLRPRGTDQSHKKEFRSVKTTKVISETLFAEHGKKTNHSIPAQHIQGFHKLLIIPPYVLGAWLGDGTSAGGGLTDAEGFISQEIRQHGFVVKKNKTKYAHNIHGILPLLRQYDLIKNKHIPTDYMRSSYSQRLELLQGLMDTDGSVTKYGRCEFTTVKKQLANNVSELCKSLGIVCKTITGRATIKGKDCGEKYRITFTTHLHVFRMPRKLMWLQKKCSKAGVRRIVACKKIESVPVKCIQVNSQEGLFLCGESFIITHNSSILDQIICKLVAMHDWKFGIFSPENHPLCLHLSKLVEIIVGKPFTTIYGVDRITQSDIDEAIGYMRDKFFFIMPEDEDLSLDSILGHARQLVRRYGIRGLIIDPWNTLEHQREFREDEHTYTGRSLRKIINFNRTNGVHTFLVAHPRKMEKRGNTGKYEVPNLYDVSGSSHHYNMVDNGISVYRDFAKGITQVHVLKVKHKHLGHSQTKAEYRFDWIRSRYNLLVNGEPAKDEGNWITKGVAQLPLPVDHAFEVAQAVSPEFPEIVTAKKPDGQEELPF